MVWFSIREFTLDDVDFAFLITDAEGWGYSRNDFTSVLEAGLGSHFIAEEFEGKHRIGMISAFNYGGRLGWIGNVAVLKEYRQRGVASALIEHAIRHLRAEGIKTIRLYSYFRSESLYEKLGFIKEGVVGVFSATHGKNELQNGGRTSGNKSNLMTADEANLQKLFELDEKCFGADRRKMLTSMIQNENAVCFVRAQGTNRDKIIGYVVASGGEAECDIGPMVCDPKQEATVRQLVEAVMNHFGADKFSLATATSNSPATRILRSLRFTKTMQVVKMRKGRNLHSGKPAWIFGAGGLEKG